MNEEEMVAAIVKLIDEYLAQTMRDPDVLARSEDFRAGYEQGFREATAAAVALLLKRKIG